LPAVDLKLTDDGELLARPPVYMAGYYDNPEMTRRAFTDDGYYCTGDIFEVSDDGYFRCTGRKKDAFSTPAGIPIYPDRIETMLESLPLVKQAILVGDKKPYLSALIVLEDGPVSQQTDSYLEPEKFAELYQNMALALDSINSRLDETDKIRAFALFSTQMPPHVYSIVGQSKVRRCRSEVTKCFAHRIDAIYSAPELGQLGRWKTTPKL